jgi:hypothetical protein
MRQRIGIAAVIVSSLLVTSASLAWAETSSVEGRESLTRAMQGAWLPLEGGLMVGEREGTPLSAKYEIDDGAFQLSIYTSKNVSSSGEAFMEVIVDYSAGMVLKAEPITDRGDLAAARAQKEAMDRAKRSLAEATAAVVKAHAGYRAVSATPRLENGQPVIEVTLVRGDDWKVVNERLD